MSQTHAPARRTEPWPASRHAPAAEHLPQGALLPEDPLPPSEAGAALDAITVAATLAAGESPRVLQREAKRGALTRVAHGHYLPEDAWRAASPEGRHRVRMWAATASARAAPPVFSHESAAVILGLPLIGTLPDRPHVTVAPGGGKSTRSVRRTQQHLRDDEVVEIDGMRLTAPLRTGVDLAASRSLLTGVVVLAQLRRSHLVSADAIAAELARRRPFRGAARVERALALSTAGSDSALESLVVVRCHDLGFEPPVQQLEVPAGGHRYRVDFAWREGRILAEAEGRAKYVAPDLLRGRSSADVVWEEKLREDLLREHCDTFIRITWADAWDGAGLAAKLLRAGVPRPGRPVRSPADAGSPGCRRPRCRRAAHAAASSLLPNPSPRPSLAPPPVSPPGYPLHPSRVHRCVERGVVRMHFRRIDALSAFGMARSGWCGRGRAGHSGRRRAEAPGGRGSRGRAAETGRL